MIINTKANSAQAADIAGIRCLPVHDDARQ
jgi:hypothetical protein